ncbi:hypothetical protein FRB99_006962 [Tulasnella sp. 403]|nr:hypothetical protein FRB99_006962 [Tulasnella sp. 403]
MLLPTRLPTLPSRSWVRSLSFDASHRPNTIAFIGLGAMGREMATNLLSKSLDRDSPGTEFVVCDAIPETANAFARGFQQLHPQAKIHVASTPGQAAQMASTVITMLPSSPQVNQVYLDESGILPSILKLRNAAADPSTCATLAIDSTTLDVSTAKDVAKRVGEAQISMVDAPVSGGKLYRFASLGLAHSTMGKTIVHCGDSGTGLAVKICNNLILGISQVAVAEAMLLGTSLGLSPALLASVINNSTGTSAVPTEFPAFSAAPPPGRCWPSAVNNPVPGALPGQAPPCERDYKGGFATKLMLKDLHLARNAAASVSAPLPLGSSSIKIYEDVTKDDELAVRDFSVVFRHLQHLGDNMNPKP